MSSRTVVCSVVGVGLAGAALALSLAHDGSRGSTPSAPEAAHAVPSATRLRAPRPPLPDFGAASTLPPAAIDAIERHGRAFRGHDDGSLSMVHTAQGFAVNVREGVTRVDALRSDASVELAHAVLVGAPAKPASRVALGACASDGSRLADGSCARRLEIERSEGLLEWWESRDGGLEQGFVVSDRPARSGQPLAVRIELEGATAQAEGARDALLVTADRRALAYRGLRAFDATGRELLAHLETDRGRALVLSVDDADARYPVVIDPVLSATPSWTAESDQETANFAYSVDGAGDVNGDGFDDVIVGARWFDAGEFNEGAAFVYFGSPSGLSATADWFVDADQSSSSFGRSVAGAGDVDGDGYADVLVGARDYDVSFMDEGAAFLFRGGPTGPSAVADWTYASGQLAANLGISVSGAGDVNADGFADVVLGASAYDDPESGEGRVYVFLGSPSGLGATPVFTAGSDLVNAYLGSSVSGAGDVDGDGYDDIVAGAWGAETTGQDNEGFVYVFRGGPSGPSGPASVVLQENQAESNFGWSVHGAGDVDGDGYDDVVVGAVGWDAGELNEGRIFVYRGGPSGLSPIYAFSAEPDLPEAFFGWSVAAAGDVDRDGFDDLLVGAPFASNGQTNEGRAYLFRGSASGLRSPYEWVAESDQADAYFGFAVASGGDVNGDDFADVVVGAFGVSDGEASEGRAFVYLATPTDAGVDAGTDAGVDAGTDAGVDAGTDAGVDAGTDAGVDAGTDAGVDAGTDAGVDAGTDAGVDAGTDAGVDAGTDAGLMVDASAGDAGTAPDGGVAVQPLIYCDCRVAGGAGAGGRPSGAMVAILAGCVGLVLRARRRAGRSRER